MSTRRLVATSAIAGLLVALLAVAVRQLFWGSDYTSSELVEFGLVTFLGITLGIVWMRWGSRDSR